LTSRPVLSGTTSPFAILSFGTIALVVRWFVGALLGSTICHADFSSTDPEGDVETVGC